MNALHAIILMIIGFLIIIHVYVIPLLDITTIYLITPKAYVVLVFVEHVNLNPLIALHVMITFIYKIIHAQKGAV
jgi:hypothetical protein